MKSSGIGGQAVIEGIMMKNREEYAVAVRKSDGEIEIEKSTYKSISSKNKLFSLPIIRGVFNFADSMILGMKTLTFSASFFEEEEEVKPSKAETFFDKIFKGKTEEIFTGVIMVFSLVMAVVLFMLLPLFIANLVRPYVSAGVLAVLEGILRIGLFVGYVLLISRMNDIKRTFMYHGAEHKCINCIEHGIDLTVDNVRNSSKQHKRCGTSFMFYVMFISIIFFLFISVDGVWMRMVSRILLVPVIAGVSYEVLRLAGSSNSAIVNLFSIPGMWMQNLTTSEPDDSMIEVAIQAVEAVFDWKEYQRENFPEKAADKGLQGVEAPL